MTGSGWDPHARRARPAKEDVTMVARCSRSAALFAVVTGIAPVALTSGATAYASRAPALANLSGNAYFPLVVGATWKYRDLGGPVAGFTTLTIHVVSAHTAASGEVVNVQDSVGAHAFTESTSSGPTGPLRSRLRPGAEPPGRRSAATAATS